MKPIRIFTPVWGADHVDWFRRGCLPSLLWPRNHEALKWANWDIFTTPADRAEVTSISNPLVAQTTIWDINTDKGVSRGRQLLEKVCLTMQRCVDNGELFCLVMPDIIYGDGSWTNMIALAQRPTVCVTAPHMRVLPSILDDHSLGMDWIYEGPLTNRHLFCRALRYAHPTWTDAEITKSPGSQFVGGVVWEQTSTGMYLVQHRIPNCWVGNIMQSDVDFMRVRDGFGMYDHDWPRKLVTEERSRVIGSSDAAFMVEITPANDNLAPLKELSPIVDLFHRSDIHHSVYRQFVSVWRAG